MSNINKILNDALETGLLNENKVTDWVGNQVDKVVRLGKETAIKSKMHKHPEQYKNTADYVPNPALPAPDENQADYVPGVTTGDTIKHYAKNPYVWGSAAALGAGLGAVALAKKLRAKKAKAAKKEDKK